MTIDHRLKRLEDQIRHIIVDIFNQKSTISEYKIKEIALTIYKEMKFP